jgi:peroxiredoxin
MIGVNSWVHDPGELKKVMIEHNITWRSFDDENSIYLQWNSPATPTFFIIDHAGMIRHKWIGKPGENSVDQALDKLILETEQGASAN